MTEKFENAKLLCSDWVLLIKGRNQPSNSLESIDHF